MRLPQQISDEEWSVLYKRLLGYALRLLSVATETDRAVPLGREARDLVQGVVAAVFHGRRTWHADRDPYAQLAGMVRSELSNLRTLQETVRRVDPRPEEDEGGAPIEFDPPSGEDVLDELISLECLGILKGFIADVTADNPALENYRMGFEDGLKAAEIADLFSIRIEDVYQARKTVQRRLTPLVMNHPCWRRPELR